MNWKEPKELPSTIFDTPGYHSTGDLEIQVGKRSALIQTHLGHEFRATVVRGNLTLTALTRLPGLPDHPALRARELLKNFVHSITRRGVRIVSLTSDWESPTLPTERATNYHQYLKQPRKTASQQLLAAQKTWTGTQAKNILGFEPVQVKEVGPKRHPDRIEVTFKKK